MNEADISITDLDHNKAIVCQTNPDSQPITSIQFKQNLCLTWSYAPLICQIPWMTFHIENIETSSPNGRLEYAFEFVDKNWRPEKEMKPNENCPRKSNNFKIRNNIFMQSCFNSIRSYWMWQPALTLWVLAWLVKNIYEIKIPNNFLHHLQMDIGFSGSFFIVKAFISSCIFSRYISL